MHKLDVEEGPLLPGLGLDQALLVEVVQVGGILGADVIGAELQTLVRGVLDLGVEGGGEPVDVHELHYLLRALLVLALLLAQGALAGEGLLEALLGNALADLVVLYHSEKEPLEGVVDEHVPGVPPHLR